MLLLLDALLGSAIRQLRNVAGSAGDMPLQIVTRNPLGRAPVARVGPDLFLLAVQQISNLPYVRLVGRRGRE